MAAQVSNSDAFDRSDSSDGSGSDEEQEQELLEARSARIDAGVGGALARLQELQDAVDTRKRGVDQDILRAEHENAKKYALRILEAATTGLRESATDVREGHRKVEKKAAELWRDMVKHNNGLLAWERKRKRAAAKAAEAQAAAAAAAAKKEADLAVVVYTDTDADIAPAQSSRRSRGASTGDVRPWHLGGGGVSHTTCPLLSSSGATSSRSSASAGHFRSVSMGNGYMLDRKARWRTNTGQFCKSPYVRREQVEALNGVE